MPTVLKRRIRHFGDSELERNYLHDTDLCNASLYGANLSKANLNGANLKEAYLYGANLQGAVGLKQEQLEQAIGNETPHVRKVFKKVVNPRQTPENRRRRIVMAMPHQESASEFPKIDNYRQPEHLHHYKRVVGNVETKTNVHITDGIANLQSTLQ